MHGTPQKCLASLSKEAKHISKPVGAHKTIVVGTRLGFLLVNYFFLNILFFILVKWLFLCKCAEIAVSQLFRRQHNPPRGEGIRITSGVVEEEDPRTATIDVAATAVEPQTRRKDKARVIVIPG